MRALVVTCLALVLLATQGSITAVAGGPTIIDLGDDIVRPDELALADLAPLAADPLDLLPFLDLVRVNSVGTDVIDVWTCDLGTGVSSVVAQLDSQVVPYFTTHSRGRILVDFVGKRAVTGGTDACLDAAAAGASAGANAAMIVMGGGGGYAGPGTGGSSWPANQRWAVVGIEGMAATAAHELGHTIWWPHSYTRQSSDEYDNAIDLMSGNYGISGSTYGSYDKPYDTAVINRYAAGWIDAAQVRDLGTAAASFRLEPSSGNGTQMAVIRAGDGYFTLGARTRSTYDPIPSVWQGVEVYEVTPCTTASPYDCPWPRYEFGFWEVIPFGRVPFDYWDLDAYSKPLAHVISAGARKTIAGRTVSVAAASGGAYTVTVSAATPPLTPFIDIAGSPFKSDIEWVYTAGITSGCTATAYCPDGYVTREQMASFLARALKLSGTAPDAFTDDESSIHEPNINLRRQGRHRHRLCGHQVLSHRPGLPRADGVLPRPCPQARRLRPRRLHRRRAEHPRAQHQPRRESRGGHRLRRQHVLPHGQRHPWPDGRLPPPGLRALGGRGAGRDMPNGHGE